MRAPGAVVDIADGTVDWPKLSVTCSNRRDCFITSKDDGHKHRAMCLRIFRNDILDKIVSFQPSS